MGNGRTDTIMVVHIPGIGSRSPHHDGVDPP